MTTKQQAYFRILGIAPTNDIALIKKAYRKKAFQYHPDRNKLPGAHQKFIRLTEAYEGLVEPQKAKVTGRPFVQKTPEEVLADRMRAARKRYQEAQKKEAEEDLVYYQKMVTGRKGLAFRVFGFISLLVSLVWFVDYTVLQEDTYVFETGHSSLNSREMCFFIKKREYCFLLDDVRRLSLNANATAYFSPVFKDLKFIKTSVVRRKSSKVVPVRSFARSFPYIPLLLCVPFFTFFFRKPVFSFTVAYIFSAGAIGFVLTFRLFSLFF